MSGDQTAKRVKFTSRVRRGLALVKYLAEASMNNDLPPAETIMARWTRAQQADYRQAIEWIEQESATEEGGEE